MNSSFASSDFLISQEPRKFKYSVEHEYETQYVFTNLCLYVLSDFVLIFALVIAQLQQ